MKAENKKQKKNKIQIFLKKQKNKKLIFPFKKKSKKLKEFLI